jgi:probable F420-dependent oxidoreductase
LTPGVFISTGFMTEREVLELTPAIERLGFDGMTFPDHLFLTDSVEGKYPHSSDGKPPFSPDTPWPDALVLIGALGPMTTTLRFVTSIHVLPLRHPVILAKAAATAARLCDGRLTLGVGAGWMRDEFDAVGVPFERRGARMSEAITVLRTLWQQGPVEHSGEFFSFPPVLMEPVPPRIPIAVGGASDAALRRTARLGDGYIMPTQPFAEMPATLERLRAALAAEGRDDSTLEIFIPCLGAPADEILAALEPGVDNVTVMPWPHPGKETTSVSEKLEHLERYAEDALAKLRVGVAA